MPASSSPDDASHCAIRLHAATARLGRQLRGTVPTADLTSAGLSVLGLLHRHGPLSPSDLAAREGVRLQTLTRLLADLEQAGLLARDADPQDARRSLLSLTREGRKRLAAQVHGREASLQRAIAQALSAAQRRQLLKACDLLDALASAIAETGTTPA